MGSLPCYKNVGLAAMLDESMSGRDRNFRCKMFRCMDFSPYGVFAVRSFRRREILPYGVFVV